MTITNQDKYFADAYSVGMVLIKIMTLGEMNFNNVLEKRDNF